MTVLLIGAPLLWGFIALFMFCLCRTGANADQRAHDAIQGWRNKETL